MEFTDLSAGNITGYNWNFGDGTTSTEQNPVHSFEPGSYTIELTVSGSGGSNYKYKVNYVIASTPVMHIVDDYFFHAIVLFLQASYRKNDLQKFILLRSKYLLNISTYSSAV